MPSLKGRIAFITGAGSGLGAAAARLFAREGASLALFSRGASDLEEVSAELSADGRDVLSIVGDVGQEEDLRRAANLIEERWGRLDVAFVNAGVNGVWAPLEQLSLFEWNETLRINLTGTFLSVKTMLPLLRRHGGSIIITSSVNGTRMFSNTGATAYATSKAAQLAFAKMIAVEMAQYQIRVNVICPGFIESKIADNTEKRDLESVKVPVEFPAGEIPLTGGRAGQAEQVAELVAFLASDASSHITGTEIYIDGAQSLLQG